MLWPQFISILLILQSVSSSEVKKFDPAKKVETVVTEKYCKFKCGKKHIACNNHGKYGPDCPGNVKELHLDNSIENLVLALHNEERNTVAGGNLKPFPPATRMAHMSWDNELAYTAKLKAHSCSNDRNHCRSTEKFEDPGQNNAWLEYSNDDKFALRQLVQNRVRDWLNASTLCKPNDIHRFHDTHKPPHIYPFTLAVTDKNTHIGCGAVHYEINPKFYFHLVCNYAHKNKVGKAVYKAGDPASECVTGKDKKYRNLCSTSEQYH